MPYSIDELTPTAMVARAPLFLAVHQKVPVHNMKEFIDYVHANPGKLNYGSSGVGSTHHLSMEALKAALKLDMTHVPFKGTSESVPALLGGHVEVAFAAYPNPERRGYHRERQDARHQRRPALADGAGRAAVWPISSRVSTLRRASASMPASARRRSCWRKSPPQSSRSRRSPESAKQFAAAGIEPHGGGGAEFKAALERESQHVAETVKAAGMKPQ